MVEIEKSLVVDEAEVQNIEIRQKYTKKAIPSEDDMIWTIQIKTAFRESLDRFDLGQNLNVVSYIFDFLSWLAIKCD